MTAPNLAKKDVLLMAVICGLSVANIYYNQPLLEAIRAHFALNAAQVGWIPTLTQLGYAFGMLLFIPLGDYFERVKLMQIFNLFSALSLIGLSVAPSFGVILLMSFAVGLTTMIPQILLPYVSHLVSGARRGQVLGTILSGLLLGILLARTVSGFVGAWLGWRGMFGCAGVALLPISWVIGRRFPRSRPDFSGSYLALLRSMEGLIRREPVLREAALIGGCLFAAFSCFWSTLIFLLEAEPFHWGMRAAGLFGLLGAAGALGAPWAGKLADRGHPRRVVIMGLSLAILSYAILWLGGSSVVALIIGVLLLDLAVQASHVANQSRIFALEPAARSRINTIYMFTYFVGGAFGSSSASWAWSRYGWSGVCALGAAFLTVGALRLGLRRSHR